MFTSVARDAIKSVSFHKDFIVQNGCGAMFTVADSTASDGTFSTKEKWASWMTFSGKEPEPSAWHYVPRNVFKNTSYVESL